MLGNVESLPEAKEINAYKKANLRTLLEGVGKEEIPLILHEAAKNKLEFGKVQEAWKILLSE